MENENIVYGRLAESVHFSGYTLERAVGELKWLLEEDRWTKVGSGYSDVNVFIKSLNFSEFKFAIEQRQEIAKKLADIGASQRATAKMLGVTPMTVNRDVTNVTPDENTCIDYEEVTEKPVTNVTPASEPVPAWITESGQKDVLQKKKTEEKKEERKEKIEEVKKKIEQENLIITNLYDVIVIDPPWEYGREYDPEGSRVASPYPEMSFDELCNIEIPAKDNCVIWLWTTHQFIWEARELLRMWGFEYKAILTWDKEQMGMGHWLRMQCEFCLLGIKGNPLWDIKDLRDIIRSKRREHSRKPPEFYEMIQKNFTGKFTDYFSREKFSDKWDCYGAETEKF